MIAITCSLKIPACSASSVGSAGPLCLLVFGAVFKISTIFCKRIKYCHIRNSFHISEELWFSEKLCFFSKAENVCSLLEERVNVLMKVLVYTCENLSSKNEC